jgi:hypothetical protein
MQNTILQLEKTLARIKGLGLTFKYVKNQTTSIIDLSDILRAQLVLLVSAFDHFIHEIVRIGLLESASGTRAKTDGFKKFSVSMAGVGLGFENPAKFDWFEIEIRTQHGWKSFQQPEKVAEALRLICDIKIWDVLQNRLNRKASDLKQQLELIVDRRNKIAHEADRIPGALDEHWPIDEAMIEDAHHFIEQLAKGIFEIVTEPPSTTASAKTTNQSI